MVGSRLCSLGLSDSLLGGREHCDIAADFDLLVVAFVQIGDKGVAMFVSKVFQVGCRS